jgi:acyl-CoA dehydrogenase
MTTMLARKPIEAAAHPEFDVLLTKVHQIGREVVAPNAASVDREARFPREAFDAFRAEKLLSAYVPAEYGGLGLNVRQVAEICEALGHYCASTAMIFAMHQIQAACIVHHALDSDWFRDYAREMVARQLLLASATTELGIGGDTRQSICALKVEDGRFTLAKQAPVISYGAEADAILVTCRRSEDAPRNDQLQVLVRREDRELKPLSAWDTLGFRGTCSPGFALESAGDARQVLPVPYAEIHSRTQHPFAHVVWSSLWLGLATDALARARAAVRAEARKNPGTTPISATRLAEADLLLDAMRGSVHGMRDEYARLLAEGDPEAFAAYGFVIRVNNLKLNASQLVLDIVTRAMVICGIAGYRNDSKLTLGRHLRDATGAGLMVNNDRILGQNATMQVALREG